MWRAVVLHKLCQQIYETDSNLIYSLAYYVCISNNGAYDDRYVSLCMWLTYAYVLTWHIVWTVVHLNLHGGLVWLLSSKLKLSLLRSDLGLNRATACLLLYNVKMCWLAITCHHCFPHELARCLFLQVSNGCVRVNGRLDLPLLNATLQLIHQ